MNSYSTPLYATHFNMQRRSRPRGRARIGGTRARPFARAVAIGRAPAARAGGCVRKFFDLRSTPDYRAYYNR